MNNNTTSLKSNANIEAILLMLHRNQMENEAKLVTELVSKVGSLENKFDEVTQELEKVNVQLNNISNPELKKIVKKSCLEIEDKCNKSKRKLKDIKSGMSNKAAEIVSAVKNQGSHGFAKLKEFLAFRKPLKDIQEQANSITKECKAVTDKIDSFSSRLTKSKEQLKIAGNTLMGKEVFKPAAKHYTQTERFTMLKKPFEAIKNICQNINVSVENKVSDKYYYKMVSKEELELLKAIKGEVKFVPSAEAKGKFIVQADKSLKEQINEVLSQKPNSNKLHQ